jgi:hypothetical protein
MNKDKLKELVKAHFNLVDHVPTKETFGELEDENGAFKFLFPGDSPAVGDDVKVITTEGQEMPAPDGFHKLKNGTTIKVEAGKITEIEKGEEMSEDEELEDEKLEEEDDISEEEFGADPAKSQVEGTAPENATTKTDPNPEEKVDTVAEMMSKLKMSMEEKIASEIAGIKEEMSKMKEKFDSFSAEPATEKTTMNGGSKSEKFSSESLQDKQMRVMSELMKNKSK